MEPRTLKLLGAAFGLLLAIWIGHTALRRSRPPRALLWQRARQARKLVISRAGERAVLLRADDAEAWRLETPFRFAARDQAVSRMLEKLSAVHLSEPLGSDPGRHADFAVTESSGVRLQGFLAGAEGPALDVIAGRTGASFNAFFVRRPGEAVIREARGMRRDEIDRAPGDWADPRICSLDQSRILSLELRTPKETLVLRQDEGAWALDGRAAPLPPETVTSRVQPMLTALTRLEADTVLPTAGPSPGHAPTASGSGTSSRYRSVGRPELRIIVRSLAADGKPPNEALELIVGPRVEAYKHDVRKTGLDAVVYRMAGWRLDPFRIARKDLQ